MSTEPFIRPLSFASVVLISFGTLRAQTDDGRALDVNLQVGPVYENPEVYQFVPTPADLVITGNVTGGRSFQGFSPLTHSSALRVGIPSATLSNFRRDSFGLTGGLPDSSLSYGLPYFSPERTATGSVDAFRTINFGARGDALSSFSLQRSDLGSTLAVPLDFSGTSLLSGQATTQRQLNVPYMPTLEGLDYSATALQNAESVRSVDDQITTDARLRLPFDEMAIRGRTSVSPTRDNEPLSFPPLPGGLTETVEATEAAPGDIAAQTSVIPGAAPTDGNAPPMIEDTGGIPQNSVAFGEASPSLPQQTGHPFIDFQTALTWMANTPGATGENDPLSEASASTTQDGYAGSYDRAVSLVEQPMTTFAGDVPTLAADYMRQAETLLKNGEFGRAAAMYRMAGTLEPANPLIDLGLGHALIGSGDFRSAFLSLSRGIERFPGFEYFRINLSAFLTDPTLLDRRRAEMERTLTSLDDYRIRFLLGYTEYFSGLPQFGIENLKKAAQAAPADSIVRRVPELLSRQPFWKRATQR